MRSHEMSAAGWVCHHWLLTAILLCCGCALPDDRRGSLDAGRELDGSDVTREDGSERWQDAAMLADPHAADASRALSTTLPWQRREVALEPDGRSAPLRFLLGSSPRPVFVLRTYAADPELSRKLCFQLEDVRADEASWVPPATSDDYGDYCTTCEQRVAVGRGHGLFVLPSAAAQPAFVNELVLRVALRDCLTLTPLSAETARPRTLVVESASYAAPPRSTQLVLPLVIVEATPHAFDAGADLAGTFARVREIWRQAGIELVLRGPLTLPRPDSPVQYGADERQVLSGLAQRADRLAQDAGVESAAPRVILTPCLSRRDESAQGMSQPLALTTHLPAGLGGSVEADAIFVAAERCGGLTPAARYQDNDSLATVIAHELGHYLGLFHVQETDGRQDALADTSVGAPSLMQALPRSDATSLADSQIEIARRHPALALGPNGK